MVPDKDLISQRCEVQTHQANADQKGGLLLVTVGNGKLMLKVFHRSRKKQRERDKEKKDRTLCSVEQHEVSEQTNK